MGAFVGFVVGKSEGLIVGTELPLNRDTDRGQWTTKSTLSSLNLGAGQTTEGHPLGISRLSEKARKTSAVDGSAVNPTKSSYNDKHDMLENYKIRCTISYEALILTPINANDAVNDTFFPPQTLVLMPSPTEYELYPFPAGWFDISPNNITLLSPSTNLLLRKLPVRPSRNSLSL